MPAPFEPGTYFRHADRKWVWKVLESDPHAVVVLGQWLVNGDDFVYINDYDIGLVYATSGPYYSNDAYHLHAIPPEIGRQIEIELALMGKSVR